MKDGVMTLEKSIGKLVEGVSGNTVRRQYVEICTKVTNREKKKKDVANLILLQRSL